MTYKQEDIRILPTPNDWPELISGIRKRPEMYLYRKSLDCFAAYVAGIEFIEKRVGKALNGFDFDSYESWVAQKYNPRQLTFNSFGLATHLEPDKDKAFELWYEWYDEFTKAHT